MSLVELYLSVAIYFVTLVVALKCQQKYERKFIVFRYKMCTI